MNIETTYTFNNVNNCYVSYCDELQFTDKAGNKLTVVLDDEHLESLIECITRRLTERKRKKLEKLQEELEELENADTDS